MKQYLDLLANVLANGKRKQNRTGIDTLMIEGAMLEFDMKEGFPAMTTKKLAFGSVKGELLAFLRGCTNAAEFRNLGCSIWDANANANTTWLENPNRKEHDDLGRIYGAQWRNFGGVDQLAELIRNVRTNPDSRRIIVSAWNPPELDQMALPPCHVMFQLLVDKKESTISLCMYQRSCDLFLGIPFNIASYALLLEIICSATGFLPSKLIMFLADVHIYVNHLEQVEEQLTRVPYELPVVSVEKGNPEWMDPLTFIETMTPADIKLYDYKCHPSIKAEMAV
jgi:thymidylate synthase